MYAYIKGIVDEKGIDRAVVEAAGVGYELLCPDSTLREITAGRETKLLAHFNITQDGVALYGFYTKEEREMFRRLIAVNRVGPKLALSILSKLSPQDIAMAIVTQNAAAFDRIPGLGKKTAARLLLELKEKVSEEEMASSSAAIPSAGGSMKLAHEQEKAVAGLGEISDGRQEAVEALVALGYDGVSAGRAVSAVGECGRVEDMITMALREMGKRSGF